MNEVIVIFGKRGSGKTTLAKKLILGRKRLFIFDTLREYKVGLVTYDIIQAIEFLTEHQDRIFRLSFSPETNDKIAFDHSCKLIYALEDLTFLIEEVDNYCSAQNVSEVFSKIIRYGRHKNISLITTSRRTAEVPRLLTSQATDFYIFSHHEPRDIDYFSHLFSPNVAEKVRQLKKLQYIHSKPESDKQDIERLTFK